jgi:hypothetical protein
MDANVMMVMGVLNQITWKDYDQNYFNFIFKNNKICNEVYYWDKMYDIYDNSYLILRCKNLDDLYPCLKKYSVIELIEFMKILIPIVSSNKDNNNILNIINAINVLNLSINNSVGGKIEI